MTHILHSFPENQEKFIQAISLLFESNNCCNDFVECLSKDIDYNKYDIIVLHSLRMGDCIFLNECELSLPVIWFFWGAEFFNKGRFHNDFILPKTKQIRRKVFFSKGLFPGLLQLAKEISPRLANFSKANKEKLSALKKINYVIPVVPGDYYLLSKSHTFEAELFHLNYVNPLVVSESLEMVNGNNILLGNSASYANNHFDAIDNLARMDLADRTIIIPLSYGDNYLARYVANYAFEKLGRTKVRVLLSFMSFSEYNKLLLSCNVVIMNHKRQQAMGGVLQSLLNGAHIYFRDESTIYQYLKECGFKVSSFDNKSTISSLTFEEALLNRNLARQVFGLELQHKKLGLLIKKALGG